MSSPIINNIDATDQYILDSVNISKKIEREYWEIILNQLDKLDSEAGILLFGKSSADVINSIMKAIRDAVQKGGYTNQLSSVLKQIGDVDDHARQIIEAINDKSIDIKTLLDRNFLVDDIVTRVASPESFKVNIDNEVRRIIARHVYLQSPIKTLKNELKDAVLTSNSNEGILSRYINQIATDTVYQYKGAVNTRIQEKYSLDAISYLGSIIATSRPQCRRWVNEKHGIILIDKKDAEIGGYLPDEVRWANNNGRGYGTKGRSSYIELTVDNFITIRGGYGCRHEAIPFKYSDKAAARSKRFAEEHDKYLEKNKQIIN